MRDTKCGTKNHDRFGDTLVVVACLAFLRRLKLGVKLAMKMLQTCH